MPKSYRGRRYIGGRKTRGRRRLTKVEKKQVVKIVRANQELKYFNSITAASGLSTTPTMFQLTNIPQGDTDTTRDGDRLKLLKFYVRGSFVFGDSTNFIRLIFFQWKPNSTPVSTSVLLPGPSGSVDYLSQYNHDLRQEYKILYDKTFTLVSYSQVGVPSNQYIPIASNSIKLFKFMRKPKSTNLQYTGGTTSGTNQVWWMAMTDSSVVPHPAIEMSVKFMFTDG
ncbi:capsid [uncultured virus]|uniref:Capsid n=1 Tax=uncultured virus TaxID=340016 RepID=A0A2K9LV44_9VIRU|nr:capsid [uncultured virus]